MAEATRVLWLAVSGSRENSLFIHIHIDHIDLFIGLKNVILTPSQMEYVFFKDMTWNMV